MNFLQATSRHLVDLNGGTIMLLPVSNPDQTAGTLYIRAWNARDADSIGDKLSAAGLSYERANAGQISRDDYVTCASTSRAIAVIALDIPAAPGLAGLQENLAGLLTQIAQATGNPKFGAPVFVAAAKEALRIRTASQAPQPRGIGKKGSRGHTFG